MKKLFFLSTVLFIVTACSNQPATIKQYYRLVNEHDSSHEIESNKRESVIISRPKALSILGGRPMVATKSDGALVQLNYHYWLESPTILLHETLKKWATHHWQQIKSAGAFNEPHERLDSHILAFEKDGKQAKVSLHFKLTHPSGKTLLDETFTQSLTIQGDEYSHFVLTMNKAVGNILDDLSEALSKLK